MKESVVLGPLNDSEKQLIMHKLRNNQLVDVSAVVTDSVKTAQNRNA